MTEREIFIAALQIDNPTDRLAHVRQACGSNEELRQRTASVVHNSWHSSHRFANASAA